MSTNPQAPQAPRSGAAAEGQSGPAYDPKAPPTPAGSEGRQSPGPCPFCGFEETPAKRITQVGNHRDGFSAVCPKCRACGPVVKSNLDIPGETRHWGDRAMDAWDRRPLAATGAPQEEGPAGVDLEAAAIALREAVRRNTVYHEAWYDLAPSVKADWMAEAEKILLAAGCLRAQAPASSPRDLEAGDLIRGMVEFLETYKAQGEMLMPYSRQWVGYAKRHLAAHPPKGETPSEAAREGLHQIMRDAATIAQRLTGDVIMLADRIHDIARASLSSLPQEGAAGEGGAG